uniref:Movement protein n=1 Tax=Lepidozia ophiovirus_sela TaxID=2983948 RepID=A0A9N6YK63_9VIRU|nr:TPA_asm: movement protein [Lepidozia ophiovirus_sela]
MDLSNMESTGYGKTESSRKPVFDVISKGNKYNGTKEITSHVGFEKGTEELLESGFRGFMTLSDPELEEQGITDMVQDFANLTANTVYSSSHVMSMKLTDLRENRTLKIGNLQKAWNVVRQSLPGVSNNQFVSFHAVDGIYLPMFPRQSANFAEKHEPKLKLSLTDVSLYPQARQLLQTVSLNASYMCRFQLSMNYFIKQKDAQNIQINAEATNIPVQGRDYGMLFLFFKLESGSQAFTRVTREPIGYYLEDCQIPKDLNYKNVLQAVRAGTEEELKKRENRAKKQIRDRNNEIQKQQSRYKFEGIKDKGGVPMITNSPYLGSKYDEEPQMAPPVIVMMATTLKNEEPNDFSTWYIDSGASHHVIQSKKISGNDKITLANGEEITGYMHKQYYASIGGVLTQLSDVFESENMTYNLLSFGSLHRSGNIDSMEINSEGWVITLKNKVKICAKLTKGNLYKIS